MLPACVCGIAALLAITARDLKVLYPTPAGRLAVAARASENPALRFLLGRLNGTSVGAFLAARWSVWGAAFAVLLTIFIVVRHTRADEEAGRLELVGSAAVGRQAPLTAALAGGRDGQRGDSHADLPLANRAENAVGRLGRTSAVHRRVRAGVRRRGRRRRPAGGRPRGAPAASRSPRSAPPSCCARSAIPVLPAGRGCPGRRRWVGGTHPRVRFIRRALVGAGPPAGGIRRLRGGGVRARRRARPQRGTAASPAGAARPPLVSCTARSAWRGGCNGLSLAAWVAAFVFAFAALGAAANGDRLDYRRQPALRQYLLRSRLPDHPQSTPTYPPSC